MSELREGTPEEAGMSAERVGRARECCEGWVRDDHTPSLAVLAARRGVVVLHEAYGVSGPGADTPRLSRDAIFPLASLTKPITGTLAMILVEEGLLALNRPAVDYLPELEAGGDGIEEISVHHLLTHSSGYTDPGTVGWSMQRTAGDPELAGLDPFIGAALQTRWDCPREHPVGSVMSYCQHNFILVGEILKRLCGQSLDELARQRLFGPLGMNSSSYGLPAESLCRRVRRPPDFPMATEISIVSAPGLESDTWADSQNGVAAVFSTASDLGAFCQMILNGGRYGDTRVLSRPAVEAMTRDQIPGLSAEIMGRKLAEGSYGYGWLIDGDTKWGIGHGSLQARGTAYHQGAGGTALWIDPHNEVVGVYLECLKQSQPDLTPLSWHFDIFQNLVTAAIDD